MKSINILNSCMALALLSGCCSSCPPNGAHGPELTASGYSTANGQYAEIGVQFTNAGDLMALISPSRWSSPIATGGSLSWLNPVAWSEDAGRTGRVLLGEAVIVGSAVGAYALTANSDNGSSSSSSSSSSTTPPPPPGGGGGDVPPPPEF